MKISYKKYEFLNTANLLTLSKNNYKCHKIENYDKINLIIGHGVLINNCKIIITSLNKTIIFTIPGRPEKFKFVCSKKESVSSQTKKKYRLEILKTLGNKLIPFHGALLEKDGFSLLISGASGSGKTTLSRSFEEEGYKCIANDFVVIWKEENKLFVGDLNFEKNNTNKLPVVLNKIILLIPNDPRDYFFLTNSEFERFYLNSLSPVNKKILLKFCCGQSAKYVEINHLAIGNRKTVGRWAKIIKSYIGNKVNNNDM